MNRLQRTIATTTLLVLAAGPVAAQEPQFAGAWVLDRSQSQFATHDGRGHDGNAATAQPPEVKLVVEQDGSLLKVTRTVTMGSRERSMTDTYVADGTDQTHRGYRGNVVTRATFEGDRLIVTQTHTKKGDQSEAMMSRQSIWALSPDGKVLTIDTTMHSPRGGRAMKTVYVRS